MKHVFLALLITTTPAWGQVGAYPDTSPTGSASEMIAKVSRAETAVSDVDRDLRDARSKLAGLKPMLLEMEEESRRLKARSDAIKEGFDRTRADYNERCATRSMVRDSAEHRSCQQLQSQAVSLTQSLEREMDGLISQHNNLMGRYRNTKNQEVSYEAQIQRLENWKSQVGPALTQLKGAIRAGCRNISNPEQLKHECGNLQFDRASTQLRPCETAACIRARLDD